jgi:hypothetical protein
MYYTLNLAKDLLKALLGKRNSYLTNQLKK